MERKLLPENLKENPVLGKLWWNVHKQDQNAFLIFVGKPGTRKSGSAATTAMEIDPSFNEKRCVFLGSQVLDLIEKGEIIDGEYVPLKAGSVILWDETGVDADNTEWYTSKAKVIKHVFTLARYRNLIVIMTTTSTSAIQIGVRRLLHAVVRMMGVPRDTSNYPASQFAEGKFYWYHENFYDSKPRYILPRYKFPNEEREIVDAMYFSRPPKEWEDSYKKKKDYYSKNWVRLFNEELKRVENRLNQENQLNRESTIDHASRAESEIRLTIDNYVVWPTGGGSPKIPYAVILEDYPELNEKQAKSLMAKLNGLIKAGRIQPQSKTS